MTSTPHHNEASPSLLEQHLALREDLCPMCGYNLHRLRGRVCPECGQALELRIALTEPRLGAFYTGLVGLAAGVGFAGLVFLWGLIVYLLHGGPELWQLTLLACEAVVLANLLIVWIRCAGRIRRLGPGLRVLLAGATWCLSLSAMLLFGLLVGN